MVTSDNGASGEGGLNGTFNESMVINAQQTSLEENMKHYDEWGGPDTYPHYHAGWAMAGNTPVQVLQADRAQRRRFRSSDHHVAQGHQVQGRSQKSIRIHHRSDGHRAGGNRHPIHGRDRRRQANLDRRQEPGLFIRQRRPHRRRGPSSTTSNWAIARCTRMDGRR